jgi:hypothetical protein
MRCAYLTTDEVNTALAGEWALEYGITLFPLAPKEGLTGREYDAVLCDWDFWPAEQRRELLADLVNGPPPCPWAVHGHNVDEDALTVLRRRGVAVHGHLDPEVFPHLRLAVLRARPVTPPVRGSKGAPEVSGEGCPPGEPSRGGS